jgi:uncharacterized protein YaiI (UPF0178 family)
MRIFIDADSCPRRVREIIVRASIREGITTFFIANREIPEVESSHSRLIKVEAEEGAVDNYILRECSQEDIVITRDIPLATELVERGVTVLNDRGTVFTRESIYERLSIRNFAKSLRESGITVRETNKFGKKQIKAFADAFDRILKNKIRQK